MEPTITVISIDELIAKLISGIRYFEKSKGIEHDDPINVQTVRKIIQFCINERLGELTCWQEYVEFKEENQTKFSKRKKQDSVWQEYITHADKQKNENHAWLLLLESTLPWMTFDFNDDLFNEFYRLHLVYIQSTITSLISRCIGSPWDLALCKLLDNGNIYIVNKGDFRLVQWTVAQTKEML